MARKKLAHSQHVPEEERPEFLAALAELPAATEVAALEQLSAGSLALLNDAMRGNAPEQVERARLLSSAVIYRLNGDTFFGCNAENGAKTRLLASQKAAPGQLPCWGQDGEWYAEVDGMRMWIESRNWMGGDTVSLAFHAVDADQPFLSDTGYRSHFLNRRHWLGHEFGAAVRLELEQCLQTKDWKLKPIRGEHRARLEVPAWLAPALEGVMGNGQQALPLSGRTPVEQPAPLPAVAVESEEPKVAMSNTERQRKLRQERNKAGIKPVYVSPAERELLGKALRLFGRVSFSPERASGDVEALLGRVQPAGPRGQELDDFALLEVGDADLQPHWASYRSDFARAATALGVLRLRNNQHAELVRAVGTLKARLVAAGLDDQVGQHKGRGEWYWNKTPLRDYLSEGAPEYMERQSAGQSVFDERDDLRRWYEVTKAERDQLSHDLHRAWDDKRDLQKQLTEAQAEIQRLKAGLQEIAAEFAGAAKPARPAANVAAQQAEVGALTEEITHLRKGLDFEKRERALMLDERNSGHVAVVEALRGEIVSLRAQLEKQHADNLFTIAEQGKAATAVSRLQRRLEAAGLPNDYRALPGEY